MKKTLFVLFVVGLFMVFPFAAHSNEGGPNGPLLDVDVTGPSSLYGGNSAQYTATAFFSGGNSQNVTSPSTWTVSPSYGTISGSGYFTAYATSTTRTVTITATYSTGGVTKSGSMTVTIYAKTYTYLSISGNAWIDENSSETFTAYAHYSDGSSVSVNATWSENSPYAYFSGNTLYTSSVTSDKTGTMTASWGGKTATKTFYILNIGHPPKDPYLY